ncbi:MAG: PD40 domain-containing protein [Nitrospirae bacterium]|nr:PD40 domain-containing protein [Nitrospirota bacterium]
MRPRGTGTLFSLALPFAWILGCAAMGCAKPQTSREVESSVVLARPEGVAGWRDPVWLDDDHLLVVFLPDDNPSRQDLAILNLASSQFRCLTCALPARNRERPVPHPNGRDVFIHSNPGKGTAWELQTYVLGGDRPLLEESPSMTGEYLLDGLSEGEGTLQDRWPSISPDGGRIAWTKVRTDGFLMLIGDLIRVDGRFRVSGPRVVGAPRGITKNSADDIRVRGAFYETKDISHGGTALAFSATRDQSMNLDDYLMDLETGEVTRHTFHPDWDEDGHWSPDGSSFVTATSRGRNVLEAFATLPLPPFGDFLQTLPVVAYQLAGSGTSRRSARRSAVLFSAEGDANGSAGIPLDDPGDEWFVGDAPRWAPDGRRLVVGEFIPRSDDQTRIRLITLRSSHAAVPIGIRSPSLDWAPFLSDYAPNPPPLETTLSGARGGTVKIVFSGSLPAGQMTIEYGDYSENGDEVLNGTQQFRTLLTDARFNEKVELSGKHSGTLTVDLTFSDKAAEGEVRSVLDGKTVERRFTPSD